MKEEEKEGGWSLRRKMEDGLVDLTSELLKSFTMGNALFVFMKVL
jgi:hypothetical protein